MSRGRKESFLWFRHISMVIVVLLQHQTCDAITNSNNQTYCPPSSCGKITNIKHPFRLKKDPTTCGDPRYELSCENNITTLTLFSGKYYVKEINYKNYTIRLVDAGIREGNCSTIPLYFLTTSNFSSYYNNGHGYRANPYVNYEVPYVNYQETLAGLGHIIYLNCSNPVKNNTMYVDTSPCVKWHSKGYIYATSGDIKIGSLSVGCRVMLVTMSSASSFNVTMSLGFTSNTILQVPNDLQPLSYSEIHEMLSYGFNLSWRRRACENVCDNDHYCSFNRTLGDITCMLSQPNPCNTPLGLLIKCGK